jgi:membrane-bound lytic murein transglycosylase D
MMSKNEINTVICTTPDGEFLGELYQHQPAINHRELSYEPLPKRHNFIDSMLSLRFVLGVIAILLICTFAQSNSANAQDGKQSTKKSVVFPDEYSDLDDNAARVNNDEINQKLETARQYYLRGLTQIERTDTAKAAKLFEYAINVLNDLASTPGIEKNEDYTDLAQAIIEDYESYVSSIDKLDDSSPITVLRDKMFQEIENITTQSKPNGAVTQFERGDTPVPTKPSNLMTTIPLTQNEYVSRSVEFLTSERGKKFFKKVIARTGKWFPMLKKIAKEEKMPEEIVHLAMIESALSCDAVSRARAVGMWQFMQATGEMYNLRVTQYVDERRDPEKATRAAMRYLRDLKNELGDWHLALAAYNCGPGGVKRAIRASGMETPDFWQIRDYLPRETKNYVPFYIATTLVTMQYETYGFKNEEIEFEQERKVDYYAVPECVSIKTLSKCAGISEEDLRKLNPELLRSTTPPTGEFKLKIPAGSLQLFASNYEVLTPEEKQPWVTHEVKRGETLASIAQEYNVSQSDILAVNSNARRLKRGQILRIPTDGTPPSQQDSTQTQSDGEEQQPSVADGTQKNKQTFDRELPASKSSGNGTASTQNPTIASNKIERTIERPVSRPSASASTTMHTVKSGETLYNIASQYGVRLTDLRNWNNLAFNDDNVIAGSTLVIKTNSKQQSSGITTLEPKQLESKFSEPRRNEVKPSVQDERLAKEGSVKTEKPSSITAKATVKKPSPPQPTTHIVRRGETLAQIADDYGMSMKEIVKLNNIKPKKGLLAGQKLTVMTKDVQEIESPATQQNITRKQAEPEESEKAVGKRISHKVRRGESIGTISATYGVRESQLRSWNPSLKDGVVNAGERLTVYSENSVKGSAPSTPKTVNKLPKMYVVRNGDTMYSIAKKYGVSVSQLEAKNGNLSATSMRPGQKIRLQ